MDKQEFFRELSDQPFSVLSELTYRYIADAIIRVEYEPGSKVNTKRIAEELGISRTPVRTALEHLLADGLVEQAGEKGYKVAPVNWRDCLDLYEIRSMLEGSCAYVAANTATAVHFQQMKQNIECCRALVEKGNFPEDIPAFNELDMQFHELVVRAAGNSYYNNMSDVLSLWVRRYTNSMIAGGSLGGFHPERITDKHAVIYRAIRSRYSMVAKTEMEDHLHHIYHVLLDAGLLTQGAQGRKAD